MADQVIVFGGGSRNTMGVVRSLGIKGVPVLLLIRADPEDNSIQFSKYVNRVHFIKSLDDGLEFLRALCCNEKKKFIVFCTSDAAICLMDENYSELKDHFLFYNANGEQGRINYFMDKINTFPLAEESGFAAIKTWHITNVHDIPVDICYPCLTKGNNSTNCTKSEMHVCNDRNELSACLHEGVDYLVQEYIRKEYEINCIGFAYNHGRNVYVPAVVRKLRDEIGRQSVYIRLDDIRDYPDLDIASIYKLVKAIGYEGMFSVELIYSNKRYYFLEINLRSDDCCWLYTAAGINYPYLWVKYNNGTLSQDDIEAIEFQTPYYLMALHDVYNMIEGKVSCLRWIKECLTADTHFVLNCKDMCPFFVSARISIRQLFKKIKCRIMSA